MLKSSASLLTSNGDSYGAHCGRPVVQVGPTLVHCSIDVISLLHVFAFMSVGSIYWSMQRLRSILTIWCLGKKKKKKKKKILEHGQTVFKG